MDDWTPPTGMRKLVCTRCRKPFATTGRVSVCQTCLSGRTASASPFDTAAAVGREWRMGTTHRVTPRHR